ESTTAAAIVSARDIPRGIRGVLATEHLELCAVDVQFVITRHAAAHVPTFDMKPGLIKRIGERLNAEVRRMSRLPVLDEGVDVARSARHAVGLHHVARRGTREPALLDNAAAGWFTARVRAGHIRKLVIPGH